MSEHAVFVKQRLGKKKEQYSLYNMENIRRCKEDSEFLGDVILANEELIWHSVHKYIGKPETLVKQYCLEKADILQLGRMGIIKAIKAFDIARGVKFSSFAVITIVREINCFLRDSGNIVRPTRTATTILQHISKIEADLGYLPTIEELSVLLGENVEQIKKALDVGRPVKYLQEPYLKSSASSHEAATAMDVLKDEGRDVEEYVLDKLFVTALLAQLQNQISSKEWQVLQLRMAGYNQTQTADFLNVSQMCVSRTMKKIQNISKNELS